MDNQASLTFIENELNAHIRRLERKRLGDRLLTVGAKITSITFTAAITVLLGLKVNGASVDLFRNIALLLGALATVVNAFDAFLDFRSLWVRRTIMLSQLYTLKRDLTFYTLHPEQGEDHVKVLDGFMKRLNQLLEEELKDWFRLREDNAPHNSLQGTGSK